MRGRDKRGGREGGERGERVIMRCPETDLQTQPSAHSCRYCHCRPCHTSETPNQEDREEYNAQI